MLFALIFILNTTVLITHGYSIFENGTEIVICNAWYNYDYRIFNIMGRVNNYLTLDLFLLKFSKVFFIFQIHLYTYSIIPFVILLIVNISLINTVYFKNKILETEEKARAKKKRMSITVCFITMLFIILTLPGAVVSGYFYLDLINDHIGSLILVICDDISFSYHSFNFFFLLISNKKIFKESKRLFNNLLNRGSNSDSKKTSTTKLNSTQN